MLPESMSGARAAWILGVWFATYVAVVLGSGPDTDSATAFIAFVAVAASLPVLIAVHELGHAAAARSVGFRVTAVSFRPFEDGYVEWEAPPERDTARRRTVAILGGAALSLLATALLVLLAVDGPAAGWRAGLVTFSLLWHADVLAPLPRHGFDVQRDGYLLGRDRAEQRARLGDHSPGQAAQLDAIDAALMAGDVERAHDAAYALLHHVGADTPSFRAAVLIRLCLADLIGGQPLRIQGEAAAASREAILHAPWDPLVQAVHRALLPRLASLQPEEPVLPPPRPATPAEAALIRRVPPPPTPDQSSQPPP